jgi:Flp pilus assembly protein TadG
MNNRAKFFLSSFARDEQGQVIPLLAALLMVVLFGLTALSIDLGRVYLGFRQLQASSDAAALAGAQALPNTTANAQAIKYSAVSGNLNTYGNLTGVSMVAGYPQVKCLTTLVNQGLPCIAPANGNAVQVKQTVRVPLYFASMVGAQPVTLTATATAAARGAASAPYNVAIILDTTGSMNLADGTSECSGSRLSCALQGVQTLLKELSPCAASESTCAMNANGTAKNAVDTVSLFTFPNVTTTTAVNDTNCSGKNPTIQPYSFPTASPTSGAGYVTTPFVNGGTTVNMTYQVTTFLSNYRNSDTSTSLTASSTLAQAVGAGGSGCPGMQAPGGEGTYYAGALYAAQAALEAQAAANPNSQNVIILLSDGDATASKTQMASSTQVPKGGLYATAAGTYPSYNSECAQAVTAAQYAASRGTQVYAVAYSPEPTGCTAGDTLTPCGTMKAIASSPQYFFTDINAGGSDKSCTSVNTMSSLAGIFAAIGSNFTYARLIPDSTT